MPRRHWPKAKPQQPKAKPAAQAKPAQHRPIAAIKRDIANSPAQALPALQAELIAALEAQRAEA